VETFEFASPEWLQKLLELRRELAREDPQLMRTTCEIYRNAPPHLANAPGGRIVWTMRVHDGDATLTAEECADEDADVKMEGDYDAVLVLAKLVIGPDNLSEAGALIRDMSRSGRIRLIRQLAGPYDPTLHNRMAAHTR